MQLLVFIHAAESPRMRMNLEAIWQGELAMAKDEASMP